MQETEGKAQQLFVCRLDFLLFRFRELDVFSSACAQGAAITTAEDRSSMVPVICLMKSL